MSATLLLQGLGASAGRATGPVVVIQGPADFDLMRDDAVLVCPMTTPEWLPVMRRASAIVTDAGGMLSHAAIVCREYGKPAVVGTQTATATLEPGQRVVVDGSDGSVHADG